MSDNISSYPSPSTPILKSIILDIRGAVHIVGVWILSVEEERPAYLRKSLQNLPSPISQNDASTTPASTPLSASSFTSSYSDANVYLRSLYFQVNDFFILSIGGSNVALLGILTLVLGQTWYVRQIIATTFAVLWGARLGLFCLYRMLKSGKDSRFESIRSKFASLLFFFVLQMIW
ncbi:9930_t:CDS:2, partial [Funneliformis caledonium]